MLLDCERNSAETFVLWSGNSDFAYSVKKLINADKKVILFATTRRIARELDELRKIGLEIFDIFDIRDFICWSREYSNKCTKDSITGAL